MEWNFSTSFILYPKAKGLARQYSCASMELFHATRLYESNCMKMPCLILFINLCIFKARVVSAFSIGAVFTQQPKSLGLHKSSSMKSPASSNTAALALTLKWTKSHTMNKTGDVVNAKQLNLMSSCGARHVHGSGTDKCNPCCHGYSAHAAQYTQTHLGCGSETAASIHEDDRL